MGRPGKVLITYTPDITIDLTSTYNTDGVVETSLECLWHVYLPVASDSTATWAVYTAVYDDLTSTWAVYTAVSVDLTSTFELESTLTVVYDDLDSEWVTNGWLYLDLTSTWATQIGLLSSVVTIEMTALKNTDVDYRAEKNTDAYLEVEA
jgi:hypothetical protein